MSRYTTIPAMLDLLVNRHLVLTDPAAWEDQNDREVMQLYAKLHPGKSVYAACMAEGSETAHHWQVFADYGQGACIRFDRDRLANALAGPGIIQDSVAYVQWRDIGPLLGLKDRLPFVKRNVFRFENEYRVVALVDREQQPIPLLPLPIGLECVTSVYVGGKVPPPLFKTLATLVRTIPGCRGIRIRHSGLLKNDIWATSLRLAITDLA